MASAATWGMSGVWGMSGFKDFPAFVPAPLAPFLAEALLAGTHPLFGAVLLLRCGALVFLLGSVLLAARSLPRGNAKA